MDKVLKQRLIGATILIALAVIFVPMLFDAPDERPTRELAIDLPDAPADRAPVRRLPLDPDQARRVAPESSAEAPERARIEPPPIVQPPSRDAVEPDDAEFDEPAMVEVAPAPESEPLAEPDPFDSETDPMPEPPAVVDAEPTPEPVTIAEPVPQPSAEELDQDLAWLVQVATFGVRASANEVVERLNRLGHVAAIDPLVRGETTLYRVVTGPYAGRDDAERARDQIVATVAGVEPMVRTGAVPTTVTTPGDQPEAGYAVQVGSFASRNNAVRLRDQLQGHELPAFLHQDQAGSRTIWRVRLGPVSSRSEAEALLERVVERMPLEGLVVSHP